MYGDNNDYDRRDSRRISTLNPSYSEENNNASSYSNSHSMSPENNYLSPTSPIRERERREPLAGATTSPTERRPRPNGQLRPSMSRSGSSFDRENGPLSPGPLSPSLSDTANSSFPLNDVDYESSPAAVAQELSNLQALRRMSMGSAATADPDLPAFNTGFLPPMPSSSSGDDDDAARLFWVPARIHPELAPKEFKSFIESKADQILHRTSGDLTPESGVERQGSGSSLRRKKSMLSRQIDNGKGYTDGADRLSRKQSGQERRNPNLEELEALVNDTSNLARWSTGSTEEMVPAGSAVAEEDMPILPARPPGQTLRRSTRTTYRRGSLKKGERVPGMRRPVQKTSGTEPEQDELSTSGRGGLSRTTTDPTPGARAGATNFSRPARGGATVQTSNSDPAAEQADEPSTNRTSAPPQPRPFQSRISSNGRTTARIPEEVQQSSQSQPIPQIVQTPPPEPVRSPSPSQSRRSPSPSQLHHHPERSSSHEPPRAKSPSAAPPAEPKPSSKRPVLVKQSSLKDAVPSSQNQNNQIGGRTPALPGAGNLSTDNLTYIPTLTEDKKVESKKASKKDSGERKSSWGWLRSNEEKEKEKEKKNEESKKNKSKLQKGTTADATRLDLLQTSINGGAGGTSPRSRESLVLDRGEQKLEEERKKEARKASGTKEKESGLLSAIFGGTKKKSDKDDSKRESNSKKHNSRNLSPSPQPVRDLKPDIDYNWTRFSILEERAIYRMAHMKLANPRRALYSQVLLSNFMYSYLAKVQQMHPHMSLVTSPAQKAAQQQQQQQQELARQQAEKERMAEGGGMSDEYRDYQRWQEVSSLFRNRTYNIAILITVIMNSNRKCNSITTRTTITAMVPCMTMSLILKMTTTMIGLGHERASMAMHMVLDIVVMDIIAEEECMVATAIMAIAVLIRRRSWTMMRTICGEILQRKEKMIFWMALVGLRLELRGFWMLVVGEISGRILAYIRFASVIYRLVSRFDFYYILLGIASGLLTESHLGLLHVCRIECCCIAKVV